MIKIKSESDKLFMLHVLMLNIIPLHKEYISFPAKQSKMNRKYKILK